jgi:hypothetical protein
MLARLYRDFNARDIDAVLAHLGPDVDWPNAASGGRVIGHAAVRAYWEKQWAEIDPIVEPITIDMDDTGRAHVKVDQLVRSLDGKVLDHRHVEHVYQFEGPFVSRMDILPLAMEPDEDEGE